MNNSNPTPLKNTETAINDLPPEVVNFIEDLFEKAVQKYHANEIPAFEKAKTTVFTSEWRGTDYPYNDCDLQTKVADDFFRLNSMGIDTMIVNIGTRYGMLALKVLSALKEESVAFRLIGAKIRGETLEGEETYQTLTWMSACDCVVYADTAEQFRNTFLSCVSYVSDEDQLTLV